MEGMGEAAAARQPPVWRSLLYVPVNVPRFVERAHTRGADAIILDLEDAVAPAEKARAREVLPAAAAQLASRGSDVLVRINRPWRLAVRDLEAAIGPNVCGLVLPKVDSAAHVRAVGEVVADLERERQVPAGRTVFVVRIESAYGLLRAEEIAAADVRVMALGLGAADFALASGMAIDSAGVIAANARVIVAARAAGRVPLGLVSSITDYGDLDAFRILAVRSREMGYEGAPCVHPAQVAVLNEVFRPSAEHVENARRIVSVYEAALAEGRGAAGLAGKMIDAPFYEEAQRLLRRHALIEQRATRPAADEGG